MSDAIHKSPFKFLDPYGAEDFSFFFGRTREVRQLYEHVNKNRIVLVYGQSGTGKTSIIRCGLANMFEPTDWLPFFVRRNGNINLSVQETVGSKWQPSGEELDAVKKELFGTAQPATGAEAAPGTITPEYKDYVARLLFSIKKHTQHSLRPVYIIFDQFEELLILGSNEEKELFIYALKYLARPNSVTCCHVIIVMREEYFGWLDFIEREIPEVADRRLRVETMRVNELREVIEKSCARFNISFSQPGENITQIVKALTRRGDISLPYLQVYLDQLWREDFNRTYPDGWNGPGEYPPLHFTTEEIKKFGEIRDVLQRFLIERKAIIQKEVREKFPHSDPDFVNSVLDCFVNDQGTKRPFAYEVEKELYRITGSQHRLFRSFDPEALTFTLNALADNQILRNNGNHFELAHDILAKLIDGMRDARQKRLNGIRIMISIYKKQNEPIPYNLVKSWERDIDKIELKDDERSFFEKSRQEGYSQEADEYVKRLLRDERNRKKFKRISIMLAFSVGILILLGFLYWKNLKRENAYYAADAVTNLDTIPDPKEALLIARYFYDYKFKEKDPLKIKNMENKFMQLARNPALTNSFAVADTLLNSPAGLLRGYDVDLSYNGNFLAVRNDLNGLANPAGDFLVWGIKPRRHVRDFRNILYAYFLHDTDTLLLALSDSSRYNQANYPNGFILYDCSRDSIISTIWMNEGKNDRNFLFDKNYLSLNTYSVWDSYKVRLDKSGRLVLPYFSLETDKQGLGTYRRLKLDVRTLDNRILFSTPSVYSVSISKNGDKAIYAYPDKKSRLVFAEYSAKGSFNNPLVTGADFADFTENDHVLYSENGNLQIKNSQGSLLRSATIGQWFRYAYVDRENNYAMMEFLDSVGVLHFNPGRIRSVKGRLAGYDFSARRFYTLVPGEQEDKSRNRLLIWNFSGDSAGDFTHAQGVESALYNIRSRSLLVKCHKAENANHQYLYLLDDTLGVKATLFLTPNDTYGFSENGEYYYYVRDNKVCIFENKRTIDVTSFETVYNWLNRQSPKKIQGYKKLIDSLLKKYSIHKFRTERFNF